MEEYTEVCAMLHIELYEYQLLIIGNPPIKFTFREAGVTNLDTRRLS